MEIEFDPAKNAANREKHGISLARAAELDVLTFVADERFAEPRFRFYGMIDGKLFCLAATLRAGRVRAISLRRARSKEVRRHDR